MNSKPCKICGEMFTPYCSSNVICSKDHYTSCPICGKQILWNTTRKVEPCSKECRKEQTRRNNLAKYGCEHPMQSKEIQKRHRQSMLDKYGVESPLQSDEIKKKANESIRKRFGTDWALGSKEVHEKIKKTMLERYGGKTTLESPILRKKVDDTVLHRYGVNYVTQVEEVKQKMTNSNFLAYGCANPMQNREIQTKAKEMRKANHGGKYWTEEMTEKLRQTSIERYGVDNPSKSPEIQEKIRRVMVETYGENYGNYLLRNVPPQNTISLINKKFEEQLRLQGYDCKFEFTGIGRYRYDIHIVGTNILIEINPTCTHNTIGNWFNNSIITKDYHVKKTQAAHDAGYQCINVFDWDDWNSLLSMLHPRKPLPARKCKIYKLHPSVADEFLDKYHIQGRCTNAVLQLGLVYQDDLVEVMSFSPCEDFEYYGELSRFCCKEGVAVTGGAQRLFKFATRSLGVENIVSYCDLSKFKGSIYSKLGMQLSRTTPPQKWWSKTDRKIKDSEELSDEAMLEDGWLPVYDCGQAVYTYQ